LVESFHLIKDFFQVAHVLDFAFVVDGALVVVDVFAAAGVATSWRD
jgi:hypothetical protein